MTLRQLVPLLDVEDIGRSVAFYVDGLGFELKNQWRPGGELRWCQVERGGTALMLQQHPAGKHEGSKGAGISLCIFCDDAVALYRRFRAAGIDAREPFVGNALWVTGVVDPDGYCARQSPGEEDEMT